MKYIPSTMTPQEGNYYQAHKHILMEKCSRVVAALGTLLFPAYYFIDAYAHRDHLNELTILRLVTTLIFLVVFLLIRKRRFIITPRILIFALLLLAAASITGMCLLTGGYKSPVYAGINLVVLTGALTYPVGALGMGFLVLSILAIYFISVLVQAGFVIGEPAIFINNIYFLLSTGIITVAAAHLTELLRKEAFLSFLRMESAQKDLKRQDEVKSRFFSNVTHELRTPLTLILGPLQDLMKSQSLSEKEIYGVKVAERNAQLLLKHVGDLMDVAKLESGEEVLDYTNTNLSHLINTVASQFELLAKEKKIDFSFEIPPGIMAEVDSRKIERVLINILSNAFKFTPHGGSIECLILENLDNKVEIRIGDSGPGIPEDLKLNVFDRFYQVEESETRSFGGTGLGLSIVQEFVLLHQGGVRVIDSSLGGAEFIVDLPTKAPEGTDVRSEELETTDVVLFRTISPELNEESEKTDDLRPLILVVEDNLDMRYFIVGVLLEKFRFAKAVNGKEGLEKAIALKPDLILSDVMMPEFSGIDLIRALRSHEDPELAETPLIFLTARSDEALRLNLLQEGANDYILKPFSSEELLLRISNLVAMKRAKDLLKGELQSSHHNVENLVQEISRALIQAKASEESAHKAMQLREDFISLVSHELKTPLTSLKLMTQFTMKKLNQSNEESNVEGLKNSLLQSDHQIERLSRVVNDMLDLSRIKYDHLQLSPTRCNLLELVNNTVNATLTEDESTKQIVDIVCEKEVFGFWDSFRIEQVIQNLLTNALKYGRGNKILITITDHKEEALFSITDHGIGIQPDKIDLIFDQFARAVDPNDYQGLGLGLYISKKITDVHQGRIEVESVFGKGSTFTLHLPYQTN